ncbi:hypothetical protein D0Z07_0496 [Hyphodiscus hymeniophilus]|uniref:Uncharacterized protein n=1 Tax=Hyphodiscus hymeniophilus TaxID=353542 RepID=A0A9P6VSG6_9HELO|nr:hypothetical protein D0Z07_0496 [Hyphodiscus hymeniophilus]
MAAILDTSQDSTWNDMDLDSRDDRDRHNQHHHARNTTITDTVLPAPDTWPGILPAPTPRIPRDTIQAVVPFSGPYKSPFTTKPPAPSDILDCLKSVNCSYLSSDIAPNLLQLKQHAQSLTVLIKGLSVSHTSALIDSSSSNLPRAGSFEDNESFDWLNDLTKRYSTDDAHHLQPLTSILNVVEEDPVSGETRNICPLQEALAEGDKIQPHPWATHQNLIRHANELLERLDHEYSARGGLLSIFPTNMQKEDRAKAEKTVLGQLIFWIQNLVQRIHHLERLYANSMDVLSKEAVVPSETLSALGARGRKGREVVYPQDRFVLVNAGDDLWEFLNAEFERKEVIDTAVDKNYRELGTTGEAIWADRGGREFAKGITAIDVYTRYYRLRNSPLKTVFVIPAHEIHPGTKVTREMEQQPTVVTVVKPVWPERMSAIEQRYKDDTLELKQSRFQLREETLKTGLQEQEVKLLYDNNAKLREEKRILIEEKNRAEKALREPPNQTKYEVFREISKANEARMEAARVRTIYEKQIADAKAAKNKADARAKEMQEARDNQVKSIAAKDAERDKEWAKRIKSLENRDKDIGRAAQEAIPALKKLWLQQMTESQILIDFLADPESQEALQNITIPGHIIQTGKDKAKKLFDVVDKQIPNIVPENEDSSSDSEHGRGTGEGADEGPPGGGGSNIAAPPNTPSWRVTGSTQSHSSGISPQPTQHGVSLNVPSVDPNRPKSQTQPRPQSSRREVPSPGKQVSFPANLEAGPSGSGKKRPANEELERGKKKQDTGQGKTGLVRGLWKPEDGITFGIDSRGGVAYADKMPSGYSSDEDEEDA